MTKGHYHHHMEEATGEPTIIEIKGEPYPEELDPELHEFNRLTKKIADAGLTARTLARRRNWSEHLKADREHSKLLDEYEKMVSGE